jgi:hypothetical protein
MLGAGCLLSSCEKHVSEEISPKGDVRVEMQVFVDGEETAATKASTVAGYTTGDGWYYEGDPVTVTAVANAGYSLVSFADVTGLYTGSSSYTFTADADRKFIARFQRNETPPTKYRFTINFTDENYIQRYEHMWVDVSLNGEKTAVELDLRTSGRWGSSFSREVTAGTSYVLSNFRSHYVASGTAEEAVNIYATTSNFGLLYCREKSGSFYTSSTISGTINANVTYHFYID